MMSKVRVYELAQQLGLEHTVVELRCRELGIGVESHLAHLTPEESKLVTEAFQSNPVGEVKQDRVRKTVIRRRKRIRDPEPAEPVIADGTQGVIPEPVDVAGAPAEASTESDASVEPAGEAVAAEAGAEAPADADAPPAPAQDASSDAPKPRDYSGEEAVNAPRAAGEPDPNRESFVKVVGKIDPALAQNLNRAAQRTEIANRRPAQGRGGLGPAGPNPMNIPLPDRTDKLGGPARDADRNKKSRGGRVAYDRAKDRGFDARMRTRGRRAKQRKRTGQSTEITTPKASKRVVKMEETITVAQLAQQLSVKGGEIIKYLMQMGEMVTVNHVLDVDTVTLIAQEYEFTVENVAFDIEDFISTDEDKAGDQVPRNAVVTVMGHVDHGKTSLLDYIRETRVAAGEAGGITQHIGAYEVPIKVGDVERTLVFLDTPGHAAFTAMRARGANVTDVVVLVVAADDGAMPQTVEAIAHARSAEVPIVVAVNKIDLEDANPDRVRKDLSEHELVPEAWGGDTQFIDVSAVTGDGIDSLLEAIHLQADLLELSAVTDGPATAVVVEAELSRGRGPVATVLVQEGTLRKGDIVVAGKAMGRVRALVNAAGETLAEAGPSTPVEVLGLNQVPQPSEKLYVVKDEKRARQVVSHIEDKDRSKRFAEGRKKVSLDDLFEQMEAGEVKTLALIIKSDVQGSLEALRTAFEKLEHPELEVRIIHAGVGPVNESDVTLAAASDGVIVGFNVRPEKKAKALAEQESVEVKLYTVIYDAVDDIRAAMEGMLSAFVEERSLGRAEVREVFKLSKSGTVAGCAVLQGKIVRHARARLVRDGTVVYTGSVDTLRRFKDNVTEVERGHECGIKLSNFNDVKQGDEIEVYELVEVAQTLEA